MARVTFTANLQRHIDLPEYQVKADTVQAALSAVFLLQPRLRSYLLDDQGRVRQHVAVFVDGKQIRDREHQSDPISANGEIYVVQALSGG